MNYVIIGKNEAQTIPELQSELARSSDPWNDIIVYVDSSSTDNSIELWMNFAVASRARVIILVVEGNVNPAIARNCGIRRLCEEPGASVEPVAFIDADVVIDGEVVKQCAEWLSSDATISSITGLIKDIPPGTKISQEIATEAGEQHVNIIASHGGIFITNLDYIASCGMFDESLDSYEDIDLCIRMRASGGKICILNRILGRHYSASYLSTKVSLRNIYSGRLISAGNFFRKHIRSAGRREVWVVTRYQWLRVFVILSLALPIWYPPAIAMSVTALIFFMFKIRQGQSVLGRAISILHAIPFLYGLISKASRPEFLVVEK